MSTVAKNACPEIDKLIGLSQSDVTSLVDDGVEVEGTIRIKNGQAILITGTVIGNIESNGSVVINASGKVRGSITAKALQIAGSVVREKDSDMVQVDGPMVLQPTAYLGCDAESVGVQMAYGASIDGTIRPRKQDGVAVPVPVPAAAVAKPAVQVQVAPLASAQPKAALSAVPFAPADAPAALPAALTKPIGTSYGADQPTDDQNRGMSAMRMGG